MTEISAFTDFTVLVIVNSRFVINRLLIIGTKLSQIIRQVQSVMLVRYLTRTH